MGRREEGKEIADLTGRWGVGSVMELTNEKKSDYSATKSKLIKKMVPLEFVSLEEF